MSSAEMCFVDTPNLTPLSFPIWAEFNAYESTTPGRVASRDGVLQMQ